MFLGEVLTYLWFLITYQVRKNFTLISNNTDLDCFCVIQQNINFQNSILNTIKTGLQDSIYLKSSLFKFSFTIIHMAEPVWEYHQTT